MAASVALGAEREMVSKRMQFSHYSGRAGSVVPYLASPHNLICSLFISQVRLPGPVGGLTLDEIEVVSRRVRLLLEHISGSSTDILQA